MSSKMQQDQTSMLNANAGTASSSKIKSPHHPIAISQNWPSSDCEDVPRSKLNGRSALGKEYSGSSSDPHHVLYHFPYAIVIHGSVKSLPT